MKKCIKIFEGLYVNLENVTAFDFTDDFQIVIFTGDESSFTVDYSDLYPNGKIEGSFFRYVKIQDIHRIKREICEYFEIDKPYLKTNTQ